MKFRIEREPWIIGQHSVPPTTEIDMAKPGQWNEIVRGKIPPLFTAVALDQEAYDLMYSNYVLGAPTGVPEVRINAGPGVKRRER